MISKKKYNQKSFVANISGSPAKPSEPNLVFRNHRSNKYNSNKHKENFHIKFQKTLLNLSISLKSKRALLI
jgi:hypothetical protein